MIPTYSCPVLRARVVIPTTILAIRPEHQLSAIGTVTTRARFDIPSLSRFTRAREESLTFLTVLPATPSPAGLNLSSRLSAIPSESQEYSRGTNRNIIVQRDSLYNNCVTDCPLYIRVFRAKVKKVTESD